MLVKKCDICGKLDGLKYLDEDDPNIKCITKFTNVPLKLKLKNFEGEDYNIYLTVQGEKASDTSKLKQLCNIKNMVKNLQNEKLEEPTEEDISLEEYNEIDELSDNMSFDSQFSEPTNDVFKIVIDNPYPAICNACKRKLSNLLVKFGSTSKFETF